MVWLVHRIKPSSVVAKCRKKKKKKRRKSQVWNGNVQIEIGGTSQSQVTTQAGRKCVLWFLYLHIFLYNWSSNSLKYPYKSLCSCLDDQQPWEALHFICIKYNCFCNQPSPGCDGVVLSLSLPETDWTMNHEMDIIFKCILHSESQFPGLLHSKC